MTRDLDRIRCRALLEKIVGADEAAWMIQDGMVVGASGFTACGYPKAVPLALAKQAKQGRKVQIELLTGASVGPELDEALVEAGVISKRAPYQSTKAMRDAINTGKVQYFDQHLSHVAQMARGGYYGKIDVALLEVCAITEDGGLVPTTSVGNSPTFVQEADFVIVEVNTSQPAELEGMHDIFVQLDAPNRREIPIYSADSRIGTTSISCPPEKICAVVFTDLPDRVAPLKPIDGTNKAIAEHFLAFLNGEIQAGRMTKNLPVMQSGVGNVGNALLSGFLHSDYENISIYTEVIQDALLDLIEAGKVHIVSGASLSPSPKGLERFKKDIGKFRDHIILRPTELSNSPEVVRRLGLIAVNTALEIDLYGNVNSSHIMGTDLMNGLGGSGDYTRNGALSVFLTQSVAKNGKISCIVPMVSHVDHTEHDVSIIITEQGVADLRNKSPKERAKEIIEKCAHPDYRPLLRAYLNHACEITGNTHTPHDLKSCFNFQLRYRETGTMKQGN